MSVAAIVLWSLITVVGTVAVLQFCSVHCNQEQNRFLRAMSEASFGVYALHAVVWPFSVFFVVKFSLNKDVQMRWLLCDAAKYGTFVSKDSFSDASVGGGLLVSVLLTNLVLWPGVWALKQLPVLRDAL